VASAMILAIVGSKLSVAQVPATRSDSCASTW
jgi:hypothetical protein